MVGEDSGVAFVNYDGGWLNLEFVAKAPEVIPIEGDRHVEEAVGIEHRLSGQAQSAASFAAADLRAEALGHYAVVAFQRRSSDQRFARRDDSVPARASDADNQTLTHFGLTFPSSGFFRSPSIGKPQPFFTVRSAAVWRRFRPPD